jgi:Flp pilus assembly protein CpaB
MLKILSRYRVRNALVASGLAALGAVLVIAYVVSYRNSVKQGADLVTVYVAARDIPEGTAGAAASGGRYLKSETVLRRNVVDGAISDPTQIADLSSAQTILAGEEITVRQFHSAAQQGVLANISGNLRAFTIPGNNYQLLAGIVSDGDRVDVLSNVRYSVKGLGQRVLSRIILRNLLVLRAPSTSTGGGGLGGAGAIGNSITFAITDDQAEKLFFAVQNTSWSLVLRPVAKPSDSPESVQTIQGLIGAGLSQSQISELTAGQGTGSIGNGQ